MFKRKHIIAQKHSIGDTDLKLIGTASNLNWINIFGSFHIYMNRNNGNRDIDTLIEPTFFVSLHRIKFILVVEMIFFQYSIGSHLTTYFRLYFSSQSMSTKPLNKRFVVSYNNL